MVTPRLIDEEDEMGKSAYSMVTEPVINGVNRDLLIDKLVTLLTE